jgi:hypothetical protein
MKNTQLAIVVGIGAIAAAYLITKGTKAAAEVAGNVAHAVNPLNRENVFYKGVSGVVDAVASDGQSIPLGVRIWEWFNPEKVASEKAMLAPSVYNSTTMNAAEALDARRDFAARDPRRLDLMPEYDPRDSLSEEFRGFY